MHDGEGTIVTVECKNGDVYRGFLDETEDNMNCVMKDVTKTDAVGKKTQLEHIFIRGSHVAFFIFPNMLKKAPMFNRVRMWKKHKGNPPRGGVADGPAGGARGQAAAIIRKAQQRQVQMKVRRARLSSSPLVRIEHSRLTSLPPVAVSRQRLSIATRRRRRSVGPEAATRLHDPSAQGP